MNTALITAHLHIPPQVAAQLRRPGDDDLLSAGYLGLCKAAQRFDPARGVPFGAFARPTVWGEMQHELRARRYGPRGGPLIDVLSLDVPVPMDGEDMRWAETLPDERRGPEELVLGGMEQEQAVMLLRRLPLEEQVAVRAWVMEEQTIPQIAERLGYSQRTARLRRDAGLARLRGLAG